MGNGGHGISEIWRASGLRYYDELIMDDIISGLTGLHSTKEVSGVTGPYHMQEDLSSSYKQMKKVYYTYSSKKGLYRRYIVNHQQLSADVLYVLLQKRKMSLSISQAVDSFNIYGNEFAQYKILDYRHQHNIQDESVHNCLNRLKSELYGIKQTFFKND